MDNISPQSLFAQKLKTAMVQRGYEPRASVLEREFNLRHYGKPVTLHAAAKWLRGEAVPRHDKIITLAKWLDIPPDELVCGTEIKADITDKQQKWEKDIGYQERELFEIFLNLPAAQKKAIREVILAFEKAYKSRP